ncbi:MAG: hypothetical protein AB7F86_17555 [Bdellovibrionales bacterium]
MSKNKTPDNVIQFPGRKRDSEPTSTETPVMENTENMAPASVITLPLVAPQAQKKAKRGRRPSKKTLAGTFVALVLMTSAVNRIAFNSHGGETYQTEFVSSSDEATVRRVIASESKPVALKRDATKEMEIAEKLASAQTRSVASSAVGRPATLLENLRWGKLQDTKYTFAYATDRHAIQSILLQDQTSDPSYVLDRAEFLKEFGPLFEQDFGSAKLKSVEKVGDRTVESYTLFNKDQKAASEARFELDSHKRLISLKVEPAQI